MSIVEIENSILSGEVTAPPSKSAAHRALVCSFLAGGGTVNPIINSNDMRATVGVLQSLKDDEKELNCIESGSTMRFMIPVAAALGKNVKFVGEGSLLSRTLGEYMELLPKHNVQVKSNGFLPLEISGRLANGSYEVNGDVSSQYITGLLMALANVDGDSAVILKTPLQSKPYVDMTIKVMADFGVHVTETEFGYLIHGNQKFKQLDYTVEGDWSQAAFFLAAGALGGKVKVKGLDFNSTQGDKEIINVLRKFSAKVTFDDTTATAEKSELFGTDINAENIPDLVPIIAVLASFAKGKTVIYGAERLRYKESNRIESVVTNLKAMGVDAEETPDGIIINGGNEPTGSDLKGYNDHRIVMAFSIAGLFAKGKTTIDDAMSINKSYPGFFEDYNMLGGRANVF